MATHYVGLVRVRTLRGWMTETVGGFPSTFWYMWFGTLINRLGAFVTLYLEIHMVSVYGFSVTYAGFVLGLYGAGMAVGSLLGGVLADRWGRRPTLLLANVCAAVTAITLGLTMDKILIALLVLVYGLWGGLGRPSFSASLVDILGPRLRMRGMNLNYWAINLGFSGAAVLAGVLAHTPRITVFALNAGVLAVSTVILAVKLPETRPSSGPSFREVGGKPEGSIWTVLTDRIFMTFVLLNFGLWTLIESCKLLPVAMLDKGLDPADYGTIIAVNGVMIVLGQLFVPKLVGRFSRTHVLAASALIVGVGMGAVAIAGSVGALALTVAVWTLGEMMNAPVNGAYLADLSKPSMRGRYQGIASMSFTFSNFVAPVFGGLILDHTPPATFWVVLFGIGLVVAAGQVVTGPARERRAAMLTTTAATTGEVRREPVAA